jgi:hypothetical protein
VFNSSVSDGDRQGAGAGALRRRRLYPAVGDGEAVPVLVHLTNGRITTKGVRGSEQARQWKVKQYLLGRWAREAVAYPIRPVSVAALLPAGLKDEGEERSEEEQQRANRDRAARRAKTMIRRKALAYDLRIMASFTFASEEYSDLGNAWKAWENFVRRMKYSGLMPTNWIVVPELQQRGVWHFHVIWDKFISVEAVRETWGLGHVWLRAGKAGSAATYASKYVTKAFEEGLEEGAEEREEQQRAAGANRYRCSRGMLIEVREELLTDEEVEAGKVEELIEQEGYRISFSIHIEEMGGTFYQLQRTGPLRLPALRILRREKGGLAAPPSGVDPNLSPPSSSFLR